MFEAYHGVSGATHQTNFDRLLKAGYRIISLSVYGDPGHPQYAAVWVKRDGPAWQAIHGTDSNGYQAFFDKWTKQGYVPTLISATGNAGNAIFAGVVEQGISGAWFSHHMATSGPEANAGTFQYYNKTAKSSKMILKSFAIYGTAADRRYAGIWHPNPGFVKWHSHPSDTGASFQTVFNAETSLPNYRACEIAVSPDHMYCSLFKDDMVGTWWARHGMTAAEYQAEFDKQNKAGFYPISVQGGGTGSDILYAAIFAKQDLPLARQWTVKGTSLPALAGLDTIMLNFMKAQAVRCAQLTIGKNGTIRQAHAYTWAEPGYRITDPSDRFLLASCSKMFLEASVQSLYDSHALHPGDKVYPKLGFSNPQDARSNDITVQQLLDHMGGYDDTATGSGFDPTYSMRQIALDMNLNHPITKADVAKYMYGKPLDFKPGANNKYSNFGYLLLSLLVEHVSGKDYFTYLKATLLDPANITEVKVWPTEANPRAANEVIHEDEGLWYSAVHPQSQVLVPSVYGGDGEVKEVGAACCGTAASATAMVQFAHLHAAWGNGSRAAGSARTGSTPGTSTMVESRGDGVDWALTINTRNWAPNAAPSLDDLEKSIDAFLNGVSI